MGGVVFPPFCLNWEQTLVEVMNIMTTSFKMPCACTATLTAPSPAADHCRPALLLETAGHSKASLGQSLVRSLLLSPGSCYTQGFGFFFSLWEPVSPVLCEFWQLYGAVNGDLLQEGLCHTQVCCTQSPCPWVRPLLIHTSAEDIQTHKGRSGLVSVGSSCVHKVYNELSKCLWWDRDKQRQILCTGFDSKRDFAPQTILLGLLLCPWRWDIIFLVGSNILLLMVV